MNLPKRLIGLILLLVASIAHASSKKKGDLFYNNFAYKDAIVEYQKSLSSGDSSVLRNLAHSHKLLHQYDQAMINYGYLVNRKEHTNDDIYAYAEMLKANHKMEEANKWMETYFANESSYDAKTHPTFNQDFLTQLNKNRGSYKIETMSINSKYIDHAPVIFEENEQEKLLFASSRKIKGNSKHKNLWTGEDIMSFTLQTNKTEIKALESLRVGM